MINLDNLQGRLEYGKQNESQAKELFLKHRGILLRDPTDEEKQLGFQQMNGVDFVADTPDGFIVVDVKGTEKFYFLQIENRNGTWKISVPNPLRNGNRTTHFLTTHSFMQQHWTVPFIYESKDKYINKFFKPFSVPKLMEKLKEYDGKLVSKDEYRPIYEDIELTCSTYFKAEYELFSRVTSDSIRIGLQKKK